MLLLLLLLVLSATSSSALPAAYDLREQHPECVALQRLFNQGACASCCVAAIATQLSLRECVSLNAAARLYSPQRIWDCAAPFAAGNCSTGVLLDDMIGAMGTGSRSRRTLMDASCLPAPILAEKDPNITQCVSSSNNDSACGGGEQALLLGGMATYHLNPYYASLDYVSQLAARALMNEIYDNGPVVSVLTFRVGSDFTNFATPGFLRDGRVFMANVSAPPSATVISHCVVVLGWGVDASSGHPYWLIQNSYGAQWADGGFARVLRGANLLEGDWRALFVSVPPSSTTPPPASSAVVQLVGLPNNDIMVLTFLSAIAFACLLVCVFSPSFLRGFF